MIKKTLTKVKTALILCFLIGTFMASLTVNYACAQTVTVAFDFDTGTPALSSQSTPFNQTSNGVIATFSSPFPNAFSIQRYETTFFKLAQFSGNYLFDNSPNRDILEIKFSAPVTSISFKFATIELEDAPGVQPTNITLTAYMDSTATTPVGSAKTRGTWPNGDSYPQGTLTYSPTDQQFNIIKIEIPFQGPKSAIDYLIDNIVVVATNPPPPTPTPSLPPVTSPSLPPATIAPNPTSSPLTSSNPSASVTPSLSPSLSSSPAPTQSLTPASTATPAVSSSPNPSPSIPEFPYAAVLTLTLIATIAVLIVNKKMTTKTTNTNIAVSKAKYIFNIAVLAISLP